MLRRVFFLTFLSLGSGIVSGQDIEAFASKSNYSIRGGLNVGTQFYTTFGDTDSRLAPFGYQIQGNMVGQLGAITLPVSFSFNHVNGSISAPFNLYGASPYYKWVKLHLGYRALSFNPYTYSGTAFFGAGISLTPGALEVTAFTGKIQNRYAIQDTVVAGAILLPSQERKIQGLKLGFGKRSANISLSVVRIKDELDPAITIFDPVENFAFGLEGSVRLWRKIRLQSNIATSIFTGDQEASAPDVTSSFEEQVRSAVTINSTSRLSFAGDAFLGYESRGYKLGLKYKRIDPFYTSLGTNYIQNDIVNYTLDGGLPLLKRRMRLRASIGIQNDNLQNQKAFTSKRFIGAVSASYIPSKSLSLQGRFSNYQHQNESGLVVVNDTLKILTTTQSISLSGMSRITENDRYATSANLNIFRNNVVDEARIEGGNVFLGTGANARMNFELKHLFLTLSPFLNVNNFKYAISKQGRVGGGVAISKSWLDRKWTNSLSLAWNQNTFDGKANGSLTNVSLSSRYKVDKRHNLNLRIFYIDNVVLVTRSYTELRGNLSYGFTFR